MTVFHEGDGDESGFTCCAFSARERFLMLGTCSGRLKLYNVFSGEEVANYTCHTSAITHLEPSRVRSHTHCHGDHILNKDQPLDASHYFLLVNVQKSQISGFCLNQEAETLCWLPHGGCQRLLLRAASECTS